MSATVAPETPGRAGARRLASAVLAALALDLALIQPNHPEAMTWGALRLFPLELPAILLTLAALPAGRRVTTAVRAAVVVLLTASFVLRTADYATYVALSRPFHPLLDMHLLMSGWHLGSGAVGRPLMAGAILAAVAVAAAVAALLWWATGRWAALELPAAVRGWAAGGAVAAGLLVVAEVGDGRAWSLPADPPGAAFMARHLVEQVADQRAAVAKLRAFRDEAAHDPWAGVAPLLDRTRGRDVVVVFVESYSAASLENPLYAPTHRATLAATGNRLAADGLAMRSAWLEAPTYGGQSWLSHATFASGLRVDDQQTYGALLASPRRGLFHIARDAGFTTAVVMPAITMDWPESLVMGFDRVLPAGALGYRGLPFGWVTMPDQFTLAALDRLVLREEAGPVFAQVALASSHAPWTPVPELVAWEDLGDGAVFDAAAVSGDPPEVVWRDPDRVREQYRRSIDYSLSAFGAYAGLHADDPPLMVVLGDHPPARFVAGDESDVVPVHLIGPPELVALADGWGWTAGLVPDPGAPLWPMSDFRDRFLAAYSSGRPPG